MQSLLASPLLLLPCPEEDCKTSRAYPPLAPEPFSGAQGNRRHASAPRPPHGNVLYPGIRGGCLRQALLPRGPWLLAGSGKDSAVRSDRRAAGGLRGGCYGLEPPVPATSFHGAVVSKESASIKISSSVGVFFLDPVCLLPSYIRQCMPYKAWCYWYNSGFSCCPNKHPLCCCTL